MFVLQIVFLIICLAKGYMRYHWHVRCIQRGYGSRWTSTVAHPTTVIVIPISDGPHDLLSVALHAARRLSLLQVSRKYRILGIQYRNH